VPRLLNQSQQPPVADLVQYHRTGTAARTTACWVCLCIHRCTGDINGIKVGDKTNIQDNVIVHVAKHSVASSSQPKPTVIGNNVTVGHGATLHACTIGDGCLVSGCQP
jgi:carbonic anhydrase/acetyltransferase-like protein (isoleucine patch superfamily)